MKLQVLFAGAQGFTVDVEDAPEQCAALIVALARQQQGAGPVPVVRPAPAPEPERPAAAPRAAAPAPRQSTAEPGRRAGGRAGRRGMVLEALRNLAASGVDTPTLTQIKRRFEVLFPEEATTHLDQVVRDLANKTRLLKRLERGTFQLMETA